jgi:hypothetical protein
MKASNDVVHKLSTASRSQLTDPLTAWEWPENLDKNQWFVSPEYVTLYGTKAWDEMSEPQRKLLSFYEACNVFSIALAGERLLVQRMAPMLYQPEYAGTTEYLHHFIEEENRHMVCFGHFCTKYAGKLYSSRHYHLPADVAEGEDEFNFWVSVMIFEEINGFHNAANAADDRVAPLAHEINAYHLREELRHLAFGRIRTPEVWNAYKDKWPAHVVARVREYVRGFMVSEYRDYFNPAVYLDAGIPNRYDARTEALQTAHSKDRFRRAIQGPMKVLTEAGVIDEAPVFEA